MSWPLNEQLYCNGQFRPRMRGKLHAVCALVFPTIGSWYMLPRTSKATRIAACGYIGSQTICYALSALYHLSNVPREAEIVLLKLDMCSIALYEMGCFFILYCVLPSSMAATFASMSTATVLWHWYHIWVKHEPSPLRLAYIGATIVPFIPYLHSYLTPVELMWMYRTIALQTAGMIVFVSRFPDPFPTLFGYHEVFHVLVVGGGVCCFLANMSILRRVNCDF